MTERLIQTDSLLAIARRELCAEPTGIEPLGGGYYGRLFRVALEGKPDAVLKVYLFPGLARKECLQLQTLREVSALTMPRVFFTCDATDDFPYDVLGMSYIPGRNAGAIARVDEPARSVIAGEIVDGLLAFHRTVNPRGFGRLDDAGFALDWRRYYYTIAMRAFDKARRLYDDQRLSTDVLRIAEKAIDRYDRVFYQPIAAARLIHGDYNTWNILLNDDATHARAIIDPFNCCWADSEFDLYQLDNANGPMYGLLPLYLERMPATESFPLKRAFYETFTELAHYYDANVPVDAARMGAQAARLETVMDEWGI